MRQIKTIYLVIHKSVAMFFT